MIPGEIEQALLAFAAEHRFVVTAQLAALAQISRPAAAARVGALTRAGYLRSKQHLHRQPTALQITAAGLRAIGSSLPPPRPVDLSLHRHDAGLGWLMLIARRGRFGAVSEVIGERAMRSRDGRAAQDAADGDGAPRFGVRLGGEGPAGGERLHYPDLVLVTPCGRRVAIELELSTKSPERRERILSAYSLDPRIDAVLYLVDHRATGEAIARSAARAGVSDLVHVQSVRFPGQARRAGPERSRHRAHGPGRGPRREPEQSR